jgi:hypothetical protein
VIDGLLAVRREMVEVHGNSGAVVDGVMLSQYSRRVTWTNLCSPREAIKGEVFHIGWFLACEYIVSHPLPDYRCEFEAMTTETGGAVEALETGELIKDGMIVAGVVVDTGPVAARDGPCQCRESLQALLMKVVNLVLC